MFRRKFRTAAGLALGATALLALSALPGAARDRDKVYADNFGNLVIESTAGYKRIVVGEGAQAKAVASYTGGSQPEVIYAQEPTATSGGDCYRPPWLVKGRSYMYGFDQGEIPFQGGPCR